MLKQIDWHFLKRPLLIFTVLTLLAVVSYVVGLDYRDSAQQSFDTLKSQLSSSYSRLRKQSREIELIGDYLAKYKQLKNDGMVGSERRLSWVESMTKANEQLKLPKFDYNIKPQGRFIRSNLKSTKKVQTLSSQMQLNLGLLHELDLFNVFDLIRQNVKSPFTINACQISLRAQQELKVDQENMAVNCSVSWLTIKVAEK